MKTHSLRRKWTSVAVIGGILVSSAASGTAWAQRDRSEVEDDIDASDADLNATVEEYNALSVEIANTKDLVSDVEADLAPFEEELNLLRDQLAEFATETYVDQGMGDVAVLLEAGSPDAFVDQLSRLNSATLYTNDVMQDLRDVTEEYQAELDLLADLQEDLAGQESDLADLVAELESRIDDLQDEWQIVAGESVTDYVAEYIPGDRGTVVTRALEQVGDRYVWGTDGPDTFDCSGLMLYAYQEVGINLPHNARMQYNQTASISRDELEPGDLVFYNDLSHVGMYIGDGLIVHAPNSRSVVKVVEVDHGNRYYGATTVLG